jgi:trimeric autotransporter adhesin
MQFFQTSGAKSLLKTAILSITLFAGSFFKLNAQTQLELSSGSLPSPSNGATVANQTATKLENTTGSTFVAYTPTITVTASFSNQQYTTIPSGVVSTSTGMVYGASTNSLGTTAVSLPVFNLMNSISSPSNASYTSNPNGTAGTGIDVTANSGFSFYNSVYPLYNTSASLTGRYYYGDLTLTFNRPVSDPVLQISGLGANVNFGGSSVQGFSSELELQTSGVTASKLSGTTEFNVTANKILNSATTLSYTSGSGAASGSVKVAGTNITTLTFKVYVRGDGNGTAWSHANINAGDVFVMGVSMNKPVTVSGNVYNDVNGLTDNTVNGTGTNVGGALKINLVEANTGRVVATTTVASNGAYSFDGIGDGSYTLQLNTNAGTQGSLAPTIALPAGWVNTGENIGTSAGNDGNINSVLPITVSGTNITNANFGIYTCPTITNPSANQTICIGQSGSNITVNTSSNTTNGIKFVRFTTDQIAGGSATPTELAAIYAGTAISTVTPTGGSAPYTATYTWNSSDFPNATTSAITYYVYAIVTPDPGTTCRPVQEITVTVNALPVIASITGTTSVCVAKTTQLADATASGVWKSVSTSVATVNASGLVTGVSAGTSIIRYTVTNGNGCVDSVSTTVTVNALPVIAAITGGTTICVAKTTQLADATSGGVWKSISTSVATVNAGGLVTGVSAGTSIIRYTVTNGNGCVDSVSTTVTVNALPVIAAITGGTTICVAKTTQLADATASGVWTSISTGVATVNATGLVTGVSAGTSIIRYTVTNGNGCVDSVSTTITVNALPIIAAITGTTSVCASSTTQLADATASGVWTSTNTSVATVNSTGLVSGISAGTSIIRYTVTNGNGCVDSVSTTVTVNALPTVSPITGNTVTAVTDQITLSNATSGGVWSSSNTAIATINASGVVTGVMTGTVTISYTVTNGSGCVTTVTYAITINPKANG